MMNKIGDKLQRCMIISNHPRAPHNHFRYFCNCISSISRETLNPQIPQNVGPSISRSKISSSSDSSSGSSSFLSSESYPLQEYSVVSDSRSRSFSIFGFGLYSFRKRQSCSSSLSGLVSNSCFDLHLPIRSRISVQSPNGLLSAGCNFSTGRPNNTCSDKQKLENTNAYRPDFVSEIIDILRNCEEDLESRLNVMSSRLSVYSVANVFEVLNNRRMPGWRFFEWVRSNNPGLRRNANICSLIVDNFGRLDDYESMFALLKMFTSEKICLTYEAFRFLPVMASASSSLNEPTQRVVGLLNKVGGSCRNSGVHALVEMFCKSNLFEMARYVIKITESRKSYYCILIREKCKIGLIEDAHSIVFEMQENHCAPNTAVYNYLLGSLGRNAKSDEAFALIDEMREFGIPPDDITFEILINFVCSLGKMDEAYKLLDQMASLGFEPRPTTHALVVKALFAAEKYDMAHEFVVDSSCKTSGNMMYSLMANLYREKGDILSAREVLVEMMEKCLKPNFSVYVNILKGLGRRGKGNLVRDLESRHKKFVVKSRA